MQMSKQTGILVYMWPIISKVLWYGTC